MSIRLVGEVLQRIYDSEIHLSLGWMWDGGIEYGIGFDISYLEGHPINTGKSNISEAVELLANDISTQYPESEFALWWSAVKK